MTKKIVNILCLILLLCANLCKAEVRIALIVPKTGEYKVWGDELIFGAQTAVDEINDQGGINGKKLELISIDDTCSDNLAISTAQMLSVSSSIKPSLVIGPYCSNSFNEVAKQMAYYHHEKWDGTGYPNGIKGKEIPLCARIMAAADVLDALLSQRLYKDPMSMDQAIRVFVESRGKHFEPCIVDAVINQRKTIENIDIEFKNNEAASNQAELEWWYRYHQIVIK